MQSEGTLRSLAAHCFTNAQKLYDDAKILYDHHRFPSAAALAVIGAEEFGKAIVFTTAALLPEQRHLLPPTLNNHELKHRVCSFAEAAKIMNEDYWAAIGRPDSALARLTDLFVPLVEHGLANCLNQKEAREYYARLRNRDHEWRQHREKFETQSEKDWGLPFREPDLKNAALYVDLDTDGRVLIPTNRVDEQSAKQVLESLEWFLKQYAELSSVVSGEQSWQDFANEVSRRLPINR
jgi:AbiV family abortive infection protein